MHGAALLVFARCLGFVARAPGFSYPGVPPPLRAGLALFLALALAPGVRTLAIPSGVAFVFMLALEFLVGAAIGTGAGLLYDGAYAGGRAVDDYVGIRAVAPNLHLVAPSGYGRLWSLAFTGGYFLLGAYRATILVLAQSFERLPPGVPPSAHAWVPFALSLGGTIALAAAGVAAPAIALAFVVQIALGALARAIPRFGSSTLAFPLVFGAALIATALALPLLALRAAQPTLLMPWSVP